MNQDPSTSMPGSLNAANLALGRRFHAALIARDWDGLAALFDAQAFWMLPGENAISGRIDGASGIVAHVQRIASYGVQFALLHVLVSREHFALLLHNTARRDDVVLDEHLATVCRVRDGHIVEMETFLSDVPGMDAFFR